MTTTTTPTAAELETVLDHAIAHDDHELRHAAYAALHSLDSRYGFGPAMPLQVSRGREACAAWLASRAGT